MRRGRVDEVVGGMVRCDERRKLATRSSDGRRDWENPWGGRESTKPLGVYRGVMKGELGNDGIAKPNESQEVPQAAVDGLEDP